MTTRLNNARSALALAVLIFCNSSFAGDEVWSVKVGSDSAKVDMVVAHEGAHYIVSKADAVKLGVDQAKISGDKVDLSSVGVVSANELTSTLSFKPLPAYRALQSFSIVDSSLFVKPADQAPGWFMNYDVEANKIGLVNSVGTMLDASTYLNGTRLRLAGLATTGNQVGIPSFQRMIAAASHDDWDTATNWTLGDSYSAAGDQVAPVSFTGFQYKRDYTLTPGFIAQPFYQLGGTATAPSTLQVLINGQSAFASQIEPGPFSVNQIVPFVGANTAQVVVTDQFGNQQVITSQLIGAPLLLKQGVSTFGVNAGVIRPTLTQSGPPMAQGFYRYGVTDSVTVEGNAEDGLSGPAGAMVLPHIAHGGVNVAFGTSAGNISLGVRDGTGLMRYMVWQDSVMVGKTVISTGTQVIFTSPEYMPVGGGPMFRHSEANTLSVQHEHEMLSALVTTNDGQDMTSLTYTHLFGNSGASASLSYSRTTGQGAPVPVYLPNPSGMGVPQTGYAPPIASNTIFLSVSIPLGDLSKRAQIFSTGLSKTSNTPALQTMDYQNAPPSGFGWNGTLHEEHNSAYSRLDGLASYMGYQTDAGVAVSSISNQQTGYRAFARGSVVGDSTGIAFGRQITNGYYMIHSETPNARISVNGIDSGITNGSGQGIASYGVYPFITQKVALDENDLPVGVDFSPVSITPYRGAGAVVDFFPVLQTFVVIPGVTSGTLNVKGVGYTITDRGAYLELPAGKYTGSIGAKQVRFVIPKRQGDSWVQETKAEIVK
jgi:outer membrane usher protein FimD/PapC